MAGDTILVGMVAGEASGDFLGAHLIAALRERVRGLRFVGIGGPRMEAQGFESWFPMEKLAVRGYVEVLRHFPEILSIRRKLERRLIEARPGLFIGVDAPDFNLGLERKLKRAGIPTVHYASPSLWGWRGGRMASMAKSVDKMLVLFPFEEALYRDAGIPVAYVGHPLADQTTDDDGTAAAREQLKLPAGRKIIALLPGSRQSELGYMARCFVETAKLIAARQQALNFLVPLISRETRAIFEEAVYAAGASDLPITVLFGHAREALAACDVALVASGTATLEAALARKPMVITYKMARLTAWMMARMATVPYAGLPNIIAGEFVVPEILQREATPENLAQAVLNSLNDPVVGRKLPERLNRMRLLLRMNAAARASEALLPWLRPA
ncbi:MAG TPA: lipid-A-disaccharide synthase [Burkholderiales bacterium]|nr:lipid-A-disaccharide synthase [Burkholderiales bacterium]